MSVSIKKVNSLPQTIEENTAYFIHIRQQVHAHPELGFSEWKTAALVAQELKKMNLIVQEKIAGTGVVAVIDSGNPGKTVALRAELDALPIVEKTQLPYQSQRTGMMHACGHDGHVATLLAAALALVKHKSEFRGKIKLIFQPAEENALCGAYAMIQEGVLSQPPVDAIFAFHNHPGAAIGKVLTRFGSVLSSNSHYHTHYFWSWGTCSHSRA